MKVLENRWKKYLGKTGTKKDSFLVPEQGLRDHSCMKRLVTRSIQNLVMDGQKYTSTRC